MSENGPKICIDTDDRFSVIVRMEAGNLRFDNCKLVGVASGTLSGGFLIEIEPDTFTVETFNPKVEKMTDEEILQSAINCFGAAAQLDMVQEECGELIAAVGQYKRDRVSRAELASECADVIIMTAQLRLLLGIKTVDQEIKKKMDRLAFRIDNLRARK